MYQCNGVTRKHTRCTFKGKYTQNAYGVELRVCKHHKEINSIHEWSLHKSITETPHQILNYLRMFSRVYKNEDLGLPFVLAVCAKLHHLADLRMPSDFLVDVFFDAILTHGDNMECPVCMVDVSNARTLECGHVFCDDCIRTWILEKPNCPMCRKCV